MGMNECIAKEVCIELKNGNKYFGILVEIDDTPKKFSWIILKLKNGSFQIFSDSEIIRVEVLEWFGILFVENVKNLNPTGNKTIKANGFV